MISDELWDMAYSNEQMAKKQVSVDSKVFTKVMNELGRQDILEDEYIACNEGDYNISSGEMYIVANYLLNVVATSSDVKARFRMPEGTQIIYAFKHEDLKFEVKKSEDDGQVFEMYLVNDEDETGCIYLK